jgi:hypothetical protein
MKKILLIIILMIPAYFIYAQMTERERQSIDSLLKTGKLSQGQIILLQRKWNAENYPELKINSRTGEVEISDILAFPGLEKKTIYQRCLEWIAISYGDLIYNDLESGKIIANGLIDLTSFIEYGTGFDGKKVRQVKTPVNYTLILTIKENRIRYLITNITYTFMDLPETATEVSFPISSIFPAKVNGPQWIRYFTILDASTDKFYFSLKSSLSDYVKDIKNDYNF